jgi:hypothetical protein
MRTTFALLLGTFVLVEAQTPVSLAPGLGAVPQAPAAGSSQTAKPSGIIRGRIVTANGRPARRASVRMMSPAGGFPRSVTADLEGRYEFTAVPAGDYRISAGKPGYVALEYGQQRAFEHGKVLTIGNDQTLEKIDIALPGSGAISGRVVDVNGDPVEAIDVRLMQLQFGANRRQLRTVPGVGSRLTNDQGGYRLYAVPPGRYIVVASVAGFRDTQSAILPPGYAATYFPGTPNPSRAKTVTVGLAEQIGDIDLALARVATAGVSGTVVDSLGRPVSAGLLLSPSQRSGAVVVEPSGIASSADGHFEFRNIPSGEWVLQAIARGTDVNQGQEGEFASRFVLVNGVDIRDIRVQTSIGSRLEGRIIFEGSGTPDPTGVTVTTLPADFDRAPLIGPGGRATVKPDGTFALNGLNGPRRLRLLRAPESWSLKAIHANGHDIIDEPVSFGTKDESLTDVEIVLTNRAADIVGSVADARGRAVEDYTLIVFATDTDRWYQGSRFLTFTRPKADGGFSVVGLPAGEYYVAAVDQMQGTEGFGEWQDPAFLESIAPRATRLTLTDGQRASVTARLIVR